MPTEKKPPKKRHQDRKHPTMRSAPAVRLVDRPDPGPADRTPQVVSGTRTPHPVPQDATPIGTDPRAPSVTKPGATVTERRTKSLTLTKRNVIDRGVAQAPVRTATPGTPKPRGPRTVTIGPSDVHVDYTKLSALAPAEHAEYFRDLYQPLIPDFELTMRLEIDNAGLGVHDRDWLEHALDLYARNAASLPPGFDHDTAVLSLIGRAARHTSTPGADGDAFESEVLRAAGWLSAVLIHRLAGPDDDQYAKLADLYGPIGSETDDQGEPLESAFQPKLVEQQLFPLLERVLMAFLLQFADLGGVAPPKPQPIDEVRKVAGFIQEFVRTALQPYSDANPQGPYSQDYRYADHVRLTTELPADLQVPWLMNRAELIGRDPKLGEVLTRANYNGSRDEDATAMRRLIRNWLDGDVRRVTLLQQAMALTAAHSSGSGVFVVPFTPNATWGTPAEWRWDTAHTLIHEFLHVLAHQTFTDAAQLIQNGQILTEGMVEVLTVDVFTQLWTRARQDRTVASLILGDSDDGRPPKKSCFEVGYGEAGRSASRVRDLMDDDHVRAAFFLGALDLIAL